MCIILGIKIFGGSGMAVWDQASAPDSIARSELQQQVQALLLGDAGALVLGMIISVVGLSAVSVFYVRRRPKARLLLWFG